MTNESNLKSNQTVCETKALQIHGLFERQTNKNKKKQNERQQIYKYDSADLA